MDREFLEALKRLNSGQEKISSDIVSIKIIQAKQEENLKEHMKRSDNLEKYLNDIEDELEPIKAHVSRVDGALKLLGIIATIVGIVGGLVAILYQVSSWI